MPMLSVAMCVHNEAERLPSCLEKLTFADELVVVLDRCTDRSRAVVESFLPKFAAGGRIIEGAFEREGDRRNRALSESRGDFILEIDADEHVSRELADEIRAKTEQPDGDWFHIPVDNYIGERLVRHGWGASFGVSAVVRLTRRGVKHWGNQRVHPKVDLAGKKGGRLLSPLAHYVDTDVSDMVARLNRYTTLRALDMADEGVSETLRHNVARMFGRFYKCYVRRKGYREGAFGFLIALMAALFPILSYLKLRLGKGK